MNEALPILYAGAVLGQKLRRESLSKAKSLSAGLSFNNFRYINVINFRNIIIWKFYCLNFFYT